MHDVVSQDRDVTRADAEALDRADPLAHMRERFVLPPTIYLDGNSLGPLPRAARERVRRCVDAEWGHHLIASWNRAGWVDLPRTVGAKIAPLVGAEPDTVRVTDSTSVNLFKMLAAALALRPDRGRIVSQRGNFPTDLYMAEGLIGLAGGGRELHLVDDVTDLDTDAPEEAIEAAITPDTAVLMLTHVDYRSGRMLDMARLTRAAHAHGALVIWDLAHSAGAVPVDLAGAGADFAVGCGYKYLNGGPGAPAFLYVAPRHQGQAANPLSGWFAHAAPFAFEPEYRAAEGADRFLAGTPPVLSMVALDAALDLWGDVAMDDVRAKSLSLSGLFLRLIEHRCPALVPTGPRRPARRGSQVSLRHPHAYAVVQCLIERGVIGDFRAPDLARFGFTPLTLRHTDVFDAVERMVEVMETQAWDAPRFHARAAVT